MSQNLEDFFLYEMQVLNHDKVIKQADRNRRFLDLIKQTLNFKHLAGGDSEEVQKQINVVGIVVGPTLVWARGRFQLKTVQVNKYNSLQVELFSKIDETITVAKIQLRFNDSQLNQEISGPFQFSKASPIILDRELYVSKENYSIHREFIQLNEVLIEIAKESPDQNGLAFIVKPYLKPQEQLLDLS